jgi:uncharacterized protein YcbX
MKSNLANLTAETMQTYKIKYNGWHNDRMLVVAADDLKKLTEKQYAALAEIAELLYPRGFYD